MKDVSDVLNRICDNGETWAADSARDVAIALSCEVEASVDWDADAGEEWLSLSVDGTRVALVSTGLRLILALDRLSARASVASQGVQIIGVPSFGEPFMRCDPAVLDRAFGEAQAFSTMNAECFSANDLWFATV